MVILQLDEFIRTQEKKNTKVKIEKNSKILMHNQFNTLMMEGLQKLYKFNPNDIVHLAFLEKQPVYKPQVVKIREVHRVSNMIFNLNSPTAMDLVHLEVLKANRELNNEYPMPRLVINTNYNRQSKRLSRFNYRIFLIFLIILLFHAIISVIYYRNYVYPKIEQPVVSFSKKLYTKIFNTLCAFLLL